MLLRYEDCENNRRVMSGHAIGAMYDLCGSTAHCVGVSAAFSKNRG
jgi:hypothetical protein